jgi:leucyl-tRNA synthetase
MGFSMHKKFDSEAIEKKWQQTWTESGIYNVGERDTNKEKEYVLVEWPYPSGNLHIGHWYAFAVPDIYVRYRRMTGKQVLYPMGFDAFGLPAENAAIKRNLDPKAWTDDNIAYMKEQLVSMGNAFSWDKTTNSTDPEYYKWTQAMFGKFFEHDIAYRGKGVVNWCPGCNTVIANEQVHPDGTCDRSGDIIERREMPQWMLRITKYADRLVDDLAALNWPEHIKEAQRQWIGRSKGALLDFKLSTGESVTVFTTRPDTLYGATYLVLAPEHPLVSQNEAVITNWEEVAAYTAKAKQTAEQDRLDATKEKTGVRLEGITATNPATGEAIPVYIADYVLGGYGTGAIMAVPAHDERDYDFAKKFDLPVIRTIGTQFIKRSEATVARQAVYGLIKNAGKYLVQYSKARDFYWLPGGGMDASESEEQTLRRELAEETGYTDIKLAKKVTTSFIDTFGTKQQAMIRNTSHVFVVELNSETMAAPTPTPEEIKEDISLLWLTKDEIKNLKTTFEPERVNLILEAINLAEGGFTTEPGLLINSGEFDGMDSEEAKEKIVAKVGGTMTSTYRLRDWSIGRQRYWGVPIPIVYDPSGKAHAIPEEHLPWLLPTDVDFKPTGEAPLAKSEALRKRTEEIFGAGWTPEVETMDTFVDSSWYFLRYLDNKNASGLSDLQKQRDWMPIDIYFGGAEHTTMHLLYSRFWQKALFDLGLVTESEPYKRRINRGLILGPDGNKMSKSKGNVIDPDEQVKRVGADTVKMYLAFMGPYEGANYPFDLGGIAGIRRFLERVYGLTEHITGTEDTDTTTLLHKTIAKVQTDIEQNKFNTAISAMMIFVNQAEKTGLKQASYEVFLKVLAPFAPHLTEEIWHELGKTTSIHLTDFPDADPLLLVNQNVVLGVQINGKLRGTVSATATMSEAEAVALAKEQGAIAAYLTGALINKVIYVPGKIISFIIEK